MPSHRGLIRFVALGAVVLGAVVAVNGALITIGTAISVVVLQWHRPSDVIGALLLVGCYTLAVSAFPLNTSVARHAVLADSGNERLSRV